MPRISAISFLKQTILKTFVGLIQESKSSRPSHADGVITLYYQSQEARRDLQHRQTALFM